MTRGAIKWMIPCALIGMCLVYDMALLDLISLEMEEVLYLVLDFATKV